MVHGRTGLCLTAHGATVGRRQLNWALADQRLSLGKTKVRQLIPRDGIKTTEFS